MFTTAVSVFVPYTETANSSLSTGFYGDVTGRLGWAWGPWMLYGKGGLAVLEAKTNVNGFSLILVIGGNCGTNYTLLPGRQQIMNSRVGWTAGGRLRISLGPGLEREGRVSVL